MMRFQAYLPIKESFSPVVSLVHKLFNFCVNNPTNLALFEGNLLTMDVLFISFADTH